MASKEPQNGGLDAAGGPRDSTALRSPGGLIPLESFDVFIHRLLHRLKGLIAWCF
jgi:hypothetical protein